MLMAAVLSANSGHAAIIITEIMYDPLGTEPAAEWIEIYNNGGSAVDLQNWQIDDIAGGESAATLTTSSFSIAAGGFVILSTRTLSVFNSTWGTSLSSAQFLQLASWAQFNNTGDEVRLLDSSSVVQSSVTYTESSPWPSGGAAGTSYGFVGDLGDASAYTLGGNWRLSSTLDGVLTSSESDTGSPGIQPVPEPVHFTLFCALGLLAICGGRTWLDSRRSRQKLNPVFQHSGFEASP